MRRFSICLGFVTLLWSAPVAATQITLSGLSSMEVQAPADTLDATLDFQVSGSTLTLTLTNNSDTNPDASDLWDVSNNSWNVSDDVTGLSLTSTTHSVEGAAPGWSLNPSDWTGLGDVNSTTQVDGFGVFDWALLFDRDNFNKKFEVGPGESIEFEIAITCALLATCDMMDFGTELSIEPGDTTPATLSLGAAKFRGTAGGNFENASGFGSTVPEPSTALLLGSGLLALAAHGRRRKA